MLGLTNSIILFALAPAFSLGGYLIEKNKFGTRFEDMMIIFSCITFCAQSVGKLWIIKIRPSNESEYFNKT